LRLLVDNNILIQILAPNKTGLTHPKTKAALERVDERAQAFVADAERRNALILIPSPVLSEFLIGVEESKYQEYLDVLNGSAQKLLSTFFLPISSTVKSVGGSWSAL